MVFYELTEDDLDFFLKIYRIDIPNTKDEKVRQAKILFKKLILNSKSLYPYPIIDLYISSKFTSKNTMDNIVKFIKNYKYSEEQNKQLAKFFYLNLYEKNFNIRLLRIINYIFHYEDDRNHDVLIKFLLPIPNSVIQNIHRNVNISEIVSHILDGEYFWKKKYKRDYGTKEMFHARLLNYTQFYIAYDIYEELGLKDVVDIDGVNFSFDSRDKIFSLDISNIKINEIQFKNFAEKLKNEDRLNSLYFSANIFSKNWIIYLSETLKVNKSLISLTLTHDHIGCEDLKFLSEALKVNKSLTSLNLSNNNIENEGLEFLSDALEENITLRFLKLSLNKINDEGIKKLSKGLKENKNIVELSLSFNEIGNRGSGFLARALKENKYMFKLDLSNNYNITGMGVKEFVKILDINKKLSVDFGSIRTVKKTKKDIENHPESRRLKF